VTLTVEEKKRLKAITEVDAGRMKACEAAEMLGLSLRQVRRLVAAYGGLRKRETGREAHPDQQNTQHLHQGLHVTAQVVLSARIPERSHVVLTVRATGTRASPLVEIGVQTECRSSPLDPRVRLHHFSSEAGSSA
jgi:hypothetical protein